MRVRYNHNVLGKQVQKALVYTQDEYHIPSCKIDREVFRILHVLHDNGFAAYIVGGAVRDLLIGKTPKDFDIATSAEPARIRKMFRNSRIIGKRFRLVHIFYGNKIYEVCTFRSLQDGTVGNTFGTIEEDVQRRDFTLNALYFDPIENIIIDYVGGVADIQNRRLRAIISLPVIFTEDPVRMIRAVKYAAITRAVLPFMLRYRIHRDAPLLENISSSRLTEEINKLMTGGYAFDIVTALLHYNLFLYLQPNAFSFMTDCPGFSEKYCAGLKELDTFVHMQGIYHQGQFLVYLIRDFLHLITDWKAPVREVYKTVYMECRKFILPMNPQRVELEYAVKYCLRLGGFDIKPVRIPKKDAVAHRSKYSHKKCKQSGGGSGKNMRRFKFELA